MYNWGEKCTRNAPFRGQDEEKGNGKVENWKFSKYGASKLERLKDQATKVERKIDN